MRWIFPTLLLSLAAACGGSVDTGLGTASPDGGVDGTTSHGTPDAMGGPDAPFYADNDLTIVPLNHRPSGSECPQLRGAGQTCGQPNCPPGNCTSDAECTMGQNGRCLAQGPAIYYSCSYDQCFDDTGCPANVPCLCRSSATDSQANVCATGSGCKVDGDCGPGGYCSPSDCGYGLGTYFCHTPQDSCTDDSDCGSTSMRCLFDTSAKRWACGPWCPPPP